MPIPKPFGIIVVRAPSTTMPNPPDAYEPESLTATEATQNDTASTTKNGRASSAAETDRTAEPSDGLPEGNSVDHELTELFNNADETEPGTESPPSSIRASGIAAINPAPDSKPLFIGMVLTHNHATTLSSTLASMAAVVDVLLVMDTGSTDNTLTIARQYTPHVWLAPSVLQSNPLPMGYAASAASSQAQNYAALLDEANRISPNGWGLWLEPTEWLLPEAQTALNKWKHEHRKARDADPNGFLLSLIPQFMGQTLRFGGLKRKEPRVFKLAHGLALDHTYYHGMDVEGTCQSLQATIQTSPYPDLANLLGGIYQLALKAVLHQLEQGRKPTTGNIGMLLKPLVAFIRQYVGNFGYLDGSPGLALAAAQAIQVHLKQMIGNQLCKEAFYQ